MLSAGLVVFIIEINEWFGKCIGEKCMAYENGRCKRLEREGAQ